MPSEKRRQQVNQSQQQQSYITAETQGGKAISSALPGAGLVGVDNGSLHKWELCGIEVSLEAWLKALCLLEPHF